MRQRRKTLDFGDFIIGSPFLINLHITNTQQVTIDHLELVLILDRS